MTMITESHVAARPFSLTGTIAGFAARIAAHLRSRRVLRDLSAMDDRLLRDIGFTRADVVQARLADFGTDRMAMLGHVRHRRTF